MGLAQIASPSQNMIVDATITTTVTVTMMSLLNYHSVQRVNSLNQPNTNSMMKTLERVSSTS